MLGYVRVMWTRRKFMKVSGGVAGGLLVGPPSSALLTGCAPGAAVAVIEASPFLTALFAGIATDLALPVIRAGIDVATDAVGGAVQLVRDQFDDSPQLEQVNQAMDPSALMTAACFGGSAGGLDENKNQDMIGWSSITRPDAEPLLLPAVVLRGLCLLQASRIADETTRQPQTPRDSLAGWFRDHTVVTDYEQVRGDDNGTLLNSQTYVCDVARATDVGWGPKKIKIEWIVPEDPKSELIQLQAMYGAPTAARPDDFGPTATEQWSYSELVKLRS